MDRTAILEFIYFQLISLNGFQDISYSGQYYFIGSVTGLVSVRRLDDDSPGDDEIIPVSHQLQPVPGELLRNPRPSLPHLLTSHL